MGPSPHMTGYVHPAAIVDPEAVLGAGVRVGPFAVIGPGVEIGDGTEVGAGAQVQGPARIGRHNRIFPQAAVGFEPQDLKFKGELVRLEVGDRNQFREFCTIHRGTAPGGGVTTIGSGNLFMAYTHVAHDCRVGDETVFANGATLAGHVEVQDHATVGAFTAVHQHCRIGRHAYLGGFTIVTMDVLPFCKTVGQHAACYGLNSIGLRRRGFSVENLSRLRRAVRILTRSGLNTRQALARLREELSGTPDIDYLIDFVGSSRRGIHKAAPRGGRGAAAEGEQPEQPEQSEPSEPAEQSERVERPARPAR